MRRSVPQKHPCENLCMTRHKGRIASSNYSTPKRLSRTLEQVRLTPTQNTDIIYSLDIKRPVKPTVRHDPSHIRLTRIQRGAGQIETPIDLNNMSFLKLQTAFGLGSPCKEYAHPSPTVIAHDRI